MATTMQALFLGTDNGYNNAGVVSWNWREKLKLQLDSRRRDLNKFRRRGKEKRRKTKIVGEVFGCTGDVLRGLPCLVTHQTCRLGIYKARHGLLVRFVCWYTHWLGAYVGLYGMPVLPTHTKLRSAEG